tara:strand:+ start:205 stop:582 length:378 start_codon:yes stop_codon:yes gene_type:complete
MPIFIMFFFALGAIVVSVCTSFYDLSFNSQIILFALFSIISMLILRSYVQKIFKGNEKKDNDSSTDSNIKTAVVSKAIEPNILGEIKYKGTFYKAQSANSIAEGINVKIVNKGDQQGSFYIVEKI